MANDRAGPTRAATVRAGFSGDGVTLRSALRSANGAVRASGLGGLARCGQITDDDLESSSADPDAAVRRRVATVLGDGTSTAIPRRLAILVTLFDDTDPSVCEVACWAAGEWSELDTAAVEHLARIATDHDDPLCRESAVAALGSLGDPVGRTAVLGACDDVIAIRRRAVLALVNFEGPDVDAAMKRLLEDRDWQVRQAAEELAAIGDADYEDETTRHANGAKPLNPTVE